MTRLPPIALGVLATLLLLAGAPAARAAQPVLKEVRIEGNRRIEVDVVRGALSLKPGQPLDLDAVDRDLRAIMKLGYFAEATAELEGPDSSPALIYRVVERPTVRETRITGNEELSKDDLKESMVLKPFSVLDLTAVQKDVKKIQEKYVEKGFFLAEVTYRLETLPENQVDVVYVVNERAKVQVREIRFIGNARVPKEDITPYLQTREGGLLPFLAGGTFKEEDFQRDIQAVAWVYMERGYVTVKVGKPTVALSPDKRYLFITIPVEEGEQYDIGKVSFSGELLKQEAFLKAKVKTRSGDRFMRSRLQADLFALSDHYKDMGYAYANVTPLTTTDAKKRIVDLEFEVQPGPKVRFERVEIVGNDKTRDKVIRRELRIYEGELYSGTGIKSSKQRVTALGFFETVEITTRKGSAEDTMVATVEVKERSTGTFQIGAGFSSYENFVLTGQISQNNFFGWGQTLSLQVQWSSVRQLGQIQFAEPYFLDTRWTFAVDLYAQEAEYDTFTRRAIGGSMTWGYDLSGLERWWPFARNLEDLRLYGTYTNERVRVSSARSDLRLANQFQTGTTSAVRLSLQWDKRDNRLFPTNGWFTSVSAETAPRFLAPSFVFGDSVNLFSRYSADLRGYRPVFLGVIARGKLSMGYITGRDVPISELFYVGGINSVRGYRYLSIGPVEMVGCAGDDPASRLCEFRIGGDKQVVLNLELEFPFFEKVGVRGVVFFDAGNAFAEGKYSDSEVDLSLYKSFGFGFRWLSPIGPLRFEWGIPLDRRRDSIDRNQYVDDAVDFQFTIGNFF